MKIHQYTMLCASIVSQEAAVEAMDQPEVDVEEMKSEYRRRRNFIHNSFREMGLPCHKPLGAFYAFPHVGHLGLSSRDFAVKFLEEERVAVVPGTAFGPCGEGFVRCAYATSLDEIAEAMRRLARFIAKLESQRPSATTSRA